jgi:hypothetical protein
MPAKCRWSKSNECHNCCRDMLLCRFGSARFSGRHFSWSAIGLQLLISVPSAVILIHCVSQIFSGAQSDYFIAASTNIGQNISKSFYWRSVLSAAETHKQIARTPLKEFSERQHSFNPLFSERIGAVCIAFHLRAHPATFLHFRPGILCWPFFHSRFLLIFALFILQQRRRQHFRSASCS